MFKLLFFVLHGIRYINRYIYGFFAKFQFCKFGKRFYIKPFMTVIGGKYIRIGNHFSAGSGFRIEAWSKFKDVKFEPEIIIGDNVCIGNNCHIGAINKIEIRDNVLMGSNILITDHSHGRTDLEELSISPLERNLYSKGEVIIEENVWIGDGVIVLPGVKIGQNSVIGANSVVTKDIPSYSVVVGNPAKIID